MKSRFFITLSCLPLLAALLAGCNMPSAAETDMPNPAALFCVDRGYTYDIRSDSAGNQFGVCVFSPNDECDGWAYYRGECEPGASLTPISVAPIEESTPAATALPIRESYQDDTFRIKLSYPTPWSLQTSMIGDFNPQSILLQFSRDQWLFSVHIKMTGDQTTIGGGLGAGDIQKTEAISLLGNISEGSSLVYGGEIKSIWYGAQTSDLEIYAKLIDSGLGDYSAVRVTNDVKLEIISILESLMRTGDPLPPAQPAIAAVPTRVPVFTGCSLDPHLVVGSQAEVTPGLPNALRTAPGKEEDSLVIGSIPGGSVVDVLDGPVCKSGYNWWKIEYLSQIGWTAEGYGGTYWILTHQAADGEEVDGWVGVMVSADDLGQVDDYFQMMDQNGSRYGIHSHDPALRELLESYRDTGTPIQVWGTLYRGRMDAYNTQIEVVRLEEF